MLLCGIAACSTYDDEQVQPHPDNIGDLEIVGDASGAFDFSAENMFGFSQQGNAEEDTQVYALRPDVNMRAWQKWHIYGLTADEFNVSYIGNCQNDGILFIAGGTMAVLFPDEFSDHDVFLDMITRDAQGNTVQFSSSVEKFHGSLANPAYRAYLIDLMKIQIDLGVDGLFLDELNVGYNGGEPWSYNGNEGYDDYFISDFNRYLINKYPDYSEQDWHDAFNMTKSNIIHPDLPYYDLSGNFNYRDYLEQHGWDVDPRNSANPLAVEWGHPVGNRYDINDNSFTGKYIGQYIKDIILTLREYARDAYSKELLITANGIMPWTDFNSLGLYEWNPDDPGNYYGADYVPVESGHLDGEVSLKDTYLYMLEKSRETSGNVPLVMFIDWPCDMINGYYDLPQSEKEDFWRIYAAEAYACGLKFAFHLRTTMPGEPTATESGILDFLCEYADFYKLNAGYYLEAENTGLTVSVGGADNVMTNITRQENEDRYLLHMVNHNYRNGQIEQQTNLTLALELDEMSAPAAVSLVSPDGGPAPVSAFSVTGNTLTVTVDRLTYYNLLVMEQ